MKYCVIDIETTGLNRFKDDITFIGAELHEDIKQPVSKHTKKKTLIFDYSKEKDQERFRNFVKKLRDRRVRLVYQNGKFDALFIEVKMGIKLPIHEDIMLMGTVYDLTEKHGLKAMAQKYLGVPDWDIKKKDKLSGSADVVVPYLKYDLKYTWELFEWFSVHLSNQQHMLYKKLLLKAYNMYRDVERNGIFLDMSQFKKVKQEYAQKEKKALRKLNDRHQINWNSSQQKQKVLFEEEGLPVIKLTPAGKPSADSSVMKRLAADGHELPQMILDYSAVNTLNKMFLNRWEDDAAYDGRLHPHFNLTNVVSGRTSCTDPNLQQVPRNKDIRSLFTAPEGRVFFEADYSQLELRIAAHYANEPTMLKIYREDGDIHTMTASLMAGGRKPTKDERSKAKAVNFGFLYGMSANKFVDYAYDNYGVVFSKSEAAHYRDAFFLKYSRLLPWHREQAELCEMLGGVPNMFGRFRKLPKIYSNKKFERLEAERRAINTPVQGTGSDILLSAAVEVHKTLSKYGLKVCGTIHDSIVGEFYEEDKDWIVDEIKRIMAHPRIMDEFGVELKVALKADVGVGPWGSK